MFRREALREYAAAALWLLPFVAGIVALLVGLAVSQLEVGPGSILDPIAFHGTAQDARDLLSAITGTVVTVIALVLGLSVVALQMASTQFSPRLLRNFLRDRRNQLVLSVFIATFAYSAAGLFTVGVSHGTRTEEFPRLAVTGAIVLLFASLAMVVVFCDHLQHSIQVDAIMRRVERETLAVIRANARSDVAVDVPTPPSWAVPLPAAASGYVQTAHPERILPTALANGVTVALRRRVGEHVVEGTTLALAWAASPDAPMPDAGAVRRALDDAVGIGFERTRQQDAAIGIRQLVDVACKALSPAVNDPYTAVQAVDHLSVIFHELARYPLGPQAARDGAGRAVVSVPSRRFGEYLATMCGLVRRYGSSEPTVSVALLRLLDSCVGVARGDAERLGDLAAQAQLVLADAARDIAQADDVVAVRTSAEALERSIDEALRA